MKSEFSAKRVTVFVGETDRFKGHALYEAIVTMLHTEGVAGATVTRGVLGYGGSGRTHSAHLFDIADDLPVLVTFVERPDVVERILPKLDEMVETGLVTIDTVDAVSYTTG